MDTLLLLSTALCSGFSLSIAYAWLSGFASRHNVLGGKISGKRDRPFEVILLGFGMMLGACCGLQVTVTDDFWHKLAIVPLSAAGLPLLAGIVVFGGFYALKIFSAIHRAVCNRARVIGIGKKAE